MSINFQQLIVSVLEDNSAGVGGVFGPTNALTTDPDVKTAMATAIPLKKFKNKKRKKPFIFRRNLPKGM